MTDSVGDPVDAIEHLYLAHGHQSYGEDVTLLDHSLLTASAAENAGAADALIVACLLHDIGHILSEADDEFGVHHHGDLAGDYLAQHFPPSVSEPVRLHIDAKRYLCAMEPDYHDALSAPSQHTLRSQGGPMTADECRDFEAQPYAGDAVQLRRWEDSMGKTPGVEPPPWSRYGPKLEALSTR